MLVVVTVTVTVDWLLVLVVDVELVVDVVFVELMDVVLLLWLVLLVVELLGVKTGASRKNQASNAVAIPPTKTMLPVRRPIFIVVAP